jgi:hypothetical protein
MTMIQFRLFFTILFLFVSLAVFVLIAIFDRSLYLNALAFVNEYLWVAGIVVVSFLVLLTSGIVSNLDSIKRSLIRNGYFQLAILELFIITAALGYFWYYNQQPGQVVLRLQPDANKEYIEVGVTYSSSGLTKVDTVRVPGKLYKRSPGTYSIEILDQDVVSFKTEVILEPTESETLYIPVTQNSKTLAIQTDPAGAAIWINGIETTNTPHTFEILTGDTVILELKSSGFQVYTDTLIMDDNRDLGIIPLKKMYTVWISPRYPDIEYYIYDEENHIVFSSRGSRNVKLAQGRYRITYGIGEGQYESKYFSLNYNSTVMIP